MQKLISKFMALPIPGKAMIGMIAAGGIFGVCHVLGLTELGYFLGIAMAVVTVVLAIFGMIVEKRDKKKAADVEANIADSAAATPAGVNKVADRAKLDDLRRQFETGVQTFRDYGKNLYDMPWYVVVGEPGSGKTEAIRHSGIGFPPGLQDQLQGTGGTVNMNWWFTDQSVIIDTAGRLMFEEVAPGENNEWKEFLKLLRTNRPNCPINGMLLVIPADTLITDKPDEIERKAGKIAQQFDQIQRSLGVRFPVFVLITKADLINGFREFFDDITDPRLTAQMMGWSNPSDLDDPFKPDRVEDHLDSLRQHLLQRRFALLQDPIHTEDPKGRRIDQVDAMYKFPEAVTELAPRLRRYLEMIFVAGEWSQKPLFLRGIYFTSSMRDGDALDADLAEVLGVGVGSLPEGKLWERERSYFLRDLFLDKVFRERGLVTRAANAGQVKRKRALLLSGTAAVASILLGLMIWYSYSQTKAKIQNPRDFWVQIKDAVVDVASEADGNENLTKASALRLYMSTIRVKVSDARDRELIIDKPLDSGVAVKSDNDTLTYLEVFEKAKQYYDKNSSSSGLFALIAALPGGGNDIFKRQLPAQRGLFDQLVTVRAVELARSDFISVGEDGARPIGWGEGEPGSGVLSTLIAMEAERSLERGEPFSVEVLENLVRFAVSSSDEAATFEEDAMQRFRDYAVWLYSDDSVWPPESLAVGSEASRAAVERGIDAFNEFWRDPSGEGTLFGALKALDAAGAELTTAEGTLKVASQELGSATTKSGYDRKRESWLSAYQDYRGAYEAFTAVLESIDDRWIGSDFSSSALPEEARLAVWESASDAYDALIDRFGDETEREKLDAEDEDDAWLLRQRTELLEARDKANESYRATAEQLVASIRDSVVDPHLRKRGLDRYYTLRSLLFGEAHAALTVEQDYGEELAIAIKAIGNPIDANSPIDNDNKLESSRSAVNQVNAAAARNARYVVMKAEADRLRDWQEMLNRTPAGALPVIPNSGLGSLTYERRFVPENNKRVRGSFAALRDAINRKNDDSSPFVLDAGELESAVAAIEAEGLTRELEDYERFWTEDVPAAVRVLPKPGDRWSDLQNDLLNASSIDRSFEDLREIMKEALGEADSASSERVAALAAAVVAEEDDRGLREKIRGLAQRWLRGLQSDPAEAGATLLLSADQKEILTEFFPLEQTSAYKDLWEVGPEETYWRSFTLAAVELIARGAAADKEGGLNAVMPLCDRFPVTIDADPRAGLSQNEIERVASTLNEFTVLKTEDPTPAARSPYSWISSNDIRGPLNRISGLGLLGDPTTVERLRRARKVSEFLATNDGKVTFTLADLGPGNPLNTRAMRLTCEQVEVEGKPNVFGEPGYTYLEKQEVFDENYYWMMPMSGRVQVRFLNQNKQANGEPPITAELGGWGPVAALDPARSPIEFGDAGQRVQIWPLEFRLSNGNSFWMGAVFTGGNAESLIELRDVWLRSRN